MTDDRRSGRASTVGHLGKILHSAAGIGRAPVGEFLGGNGAYSRISCTYYTASGTVVGDWTK